MNNNLTVVIAIVVIVTGAGFLAAQKRQENRTARRESFAIVQGEVDGHPVIATIDMSLRDFPEKPTLPFFLSIGTKLTNPDANGFPTREEADNLNAWEDKVEAHLRPHGKLVFVGRVTWNGERELLYYVDKKDPFVEVLKSLLDAHSTRLFAFSCERDEQWSKADFWLKRQ